MHEYGEIYYEQELYDADTARESMYCARCGTYHGGSC